MGTQVIIEARTKTVRASLDAPGEGTTIFAVDLIGDTWDDFAYFSEQAAHFESVHDLLMRNRYMRVAIAALFSHLDGLVLELFSTLGKETAFKAYMPKNARSSLKDKMTALGKFLADERTIRLPSVDLNMKALRDIINHPSVTKSVCAVGSNETLQYDSADVYGITTDDLAASASAIDQWLHAACKAAGYERFRDTKRLCENFARELGGAHDLVKEF